MPRRSLSLLLGTLLATLPAGASHAQHRGGGEDAVQRHTGKSAWIHRFLLALSIDTGLDAWQQKEAMKCRIELDFDAQHDDASSDAHEDGQPPQKPCHALHGTLTYEIDSRRMRLDLDDGLSFIVQPDAIRAWRRQTTADHEKLAREEIANETLATATALAYLIAMPLRLCEPDAQFNAGGMSTSLNLPLYSASIIVPGTMKPIDDAEDRASSRPPPNDWYIAFMTTTQPHQLHAVSYLVHDRSARATDFPKPRIVFFEEYETTDGVAIPRSWRFHQFSRVEGVGTKIGTAKILQFEFVPREKDLFEASDTALELR
jgi:hypothetical protein